MSFYLGLPVEFHIKTNNKIFRGDLTKFSRIIYPHFRFLLNYFGDHFQASLQSRRFLRNERLFNDRLLFFYEMNACLTIVCLGRHFESK